MKKNLPIIVGISLPIIVVLVLFLFITLPNLGSAPEYNFIFLEEDPYNTRYLNRFEIENNKIVQKSTKLVIEEIEDLPINVDFKNSPELYLYDTKNKIIKNITFDEAQNLIIDRGPTSPDGYVVDFEYRRNYNIADDLFGSSNRNYNAYFVKGNKVKGIYLPNLGNRYYNNNAFIGWVLN